ncbi:MAG: tryptophan--tRNA ligase [Christensenellales bacterium]|jgi:tryptophanyl-tRNA synthetase
MQPNERKQRIFSGIQPTGVFTIGNYIGAMRNWTLLQEEYDCLYCVVDLHALTIRNKPADLRQGSMRALALLIAAGLDPNKNILYFQSHVPQHAELSWILNCYTYVGELSRMTQFKDKAEKHSDNINAGLFDYPVLMAADILLFNADLVPVGTDQRQHIEITRDIAIRFNNIYGDTFTVPDAYYGKEGAKILSLSDPARKMSKSDEPGSAIFLLDEPDVIVRKMKRAVTDSGSGIIYGEDKPGISNLMTIHAVMSGRTIEQVQNDCEGMGYGDFKLLVADSVIAALKPIQDEYQRLAADKGYLTQVMKDGAAKAERIAARTLSKVHRKIGLVQR